MSNVILKRNTDDGSVTKGTLTVGDFSCQTLELGWHNNVVDISCIPSGTYDCTWKYQNDLKEYHYAVQGVYDRTGVYIHQGNEQKDTEGCILLGNSYNGDEVLNSLITLAKFEELMGQQDFTLIIQSVDIITNNNSEVTHVTSQNNMNIQKIARIESITTTVVYDKMEVDENALLVDGNMPPLEGTLGLNETVTYPSTRTLEAIVADIQSKVGADYPVSPAFGVN